MDNMPGLILTETVPISRLLALFQIIIKSVHVESARRNGKEREGARERERWQGFQRLSLHVHLLDSDGPQQR
jgi:hypothetical protein